MTTKQNLSPDEDKALSNWISCALTHYGCTRKPELMVDFVKLLLKRNPAKMEEKLKTFLPDKASIFVEQLLKCLEKKDFSIPEGSTQSPEVAKPQKPQHSQSSETTIQSSHQKLEQESSQQLSKAKSTPPKSSQEVRIKKEPETTLHQHPVKQEPESVGYPVKTEQNLSLHQKVSSPKDNSEPIQSKPEESRSERDSAETFSEKKVNVRTTEPPQKYIVFVAGVDKNNGSILSIYNKFTKFGRILAIEVDLDEQVAYIEFDELLSCYRCIKSNNKRSIFGNPFIKIDYAIAPDPQKLAQLDEANRLRKEQALQYAQQQQQKKQEEAAANENQSEEQKLKLQVTKEIQKYQEILKNATNSQEIERATNAISVCQDMLQELG